MKCNLYMIVADADSLPIREHGFGDKAPFKIGIATNLSARFRGIQTGNHLSLSVLKAWVFPAKKSAQGAEMRIHEELARFRVRGEWFFHNIDTAIVCIDKIFDEIGYNARLADVSKMAAASRRAPLRRLEILEKRTDQLTHEFGEIAGEITDDVRQAAYLTALAEKVRRDYNRKACVPFPMVERSELAATRAIIKLDPELFSKGSLFDLKYVYDQLQFKYRRLAQQFKPNYDLASPANRESPV